MQPVLLIDEIDKADIEFPNDLLRELDRMEFYVYETRELVQARHRPIIIITSNNEKELPDAFLRRCFFHYIRFPDEATMRAIVGVHFPNLKHELLAEALTVFFDVRATPGLKKKPSTSELLDWIKLLVAEDIAPEALRSSDAKKVIPVLHGALLKNEQDVHLFEQLVFMHRRGALRVAATVLVRFFFELRRAGIPVSISEFLMLLAALTCARGPGLGAGLLLPCARLSHQGRASLRPLRLCLRGSVRGARRSSSGSCWRKVPAEWLRALGARIFSAEDKQRIEALGGWDKLLETLRERLREQQERHEGGNKWIGTGGTSPFGAHGL